MEDMWEMVRGWVGLHGVITYNVCGACYGGVSALVRSRRGVERFGGGTPPRPWEVIGASSEVIVEWEVQCRL